MDTEKQDDEKKALLNGQLVNPTTYTKLSKRRFLIGPIFLLQAFCFTLQQLTVVQYSYFAFTKMYFPEKTANLSIISQKDTCIKTNQSEEDILASSKIQTLSSNFNIYITLAFAIPNIFSNLVIGSFSDAYGRKMFLCISLGGFFIRSILIAFSINFEINIYCFVLFSFLDGCTGSIFGTITIILAYIADYTTPGRHRVIFIVVLEMTLGVGALVGALASGYFIKATGYLIPAIFVCCVLLLSAFLIVFLPESLQKFNTRPKESILKKFSNVLKFYSNEENSIKRTVYILCISIITCMALCNHGRSNVETLYQLNTPFCWNSVLIGWYLAIRLCAQTIVGVVLIRLFMCCLGDEMIGMFGAMSSSASFVLETFATTSLELIFVPVVGVGSMMTSPVVKAYMSKITAADRQGTLFAGIGFVEALCNLLGTLVFNSIYSATVGTLVFIIMACLSGLAVVLLIVLKVINTISNNQLKDEEVAVPEMT